MRLSKSKFVAGCQCLKRLYWQIHAPELAAEPSAASEAVMEQGCEVGLLARQLFPGGVEVCSESGLGQAIRATRELVANREVPAIFEAAFEHDGVVVRVDVLHHRGDGRWRLIEVKSSASVKEEHLDDMAIQYRVLSRCGLDVGSCCLAHVNRNYVFQGGMVDPWRFFRIRNVTRQVARLQPKLTFQLRAAFTILSLPAAPQIAPGRHCVSPITCEFYDPCNPPLPDDHIGYLPRLHASAMEELEELGIESIHEVPDDFALTEIQRRAADCVRTGEPWYNREALKTELAALKFPVRYMDFETINPAIPRFLGMRPYQQIPFQFSVHSQHEPGAEPVHCEFLAPDSSDPRLGFTASLCNALGENGSIVVYNRQFEQGRLEELATWLPEYANRIRSIEARLFDLLPVIRKHVYHPRFGGSFSLKDVLPALVAEMSYSGMRVADGQAAGLAWEALVRGNVDGSDGDGDKLKRALLDYCRLDTLALVKLLEQLKLKASNRLQK